MPIFMKKKTKTRRRILRRIIVTILVLALLAGGAWIACRALKQEYSVTYQGYTATTGSISNALSFSGNLSLVSSESYSASSASTVRTVYVSAGDEVNEGDKLVRLANGQTVEAGLDGRVNAVSVVEGDSVAAGAALVQVADFTHLKVQLRVDEYDVGSVHVGDACTATATEKTFESEIAAIDYISASGGSVAYYTATAYVDVYDGVYPGMQVTVSIPQEQAENVVILKEAALSFDAANSAYVWMYNDAGELERVSIARALAGNPSILLADEPTGALDQKTGRQVMQLFQELSDEGRTIVMITHDMNIAAHARRVVHIIDGELTEGGGTGDA